MTDEASARAEARRDARVLIVGGGPFQLDVIRAAKRVVREVWVVDRDANAKGMALADRAVAMDFGRPEQVIELAQRERFDGVTTAASDAAVATVAACVQACGLTGLQPSVAQRCRDKLESNQALARVGLRVPHTREAIDAAAALSGVERVGGYPAVIKPRSAAGGRGVTIVRNPAQVPGAFERAMGYARPGQGCLVQELIGGHSVGCEAFLWEGRVAAAFCLSDQYSDGFVSPIGHALPCDLDEATQARVVRAVQEFCTALGLRGGPFNFDLRLEPRQVCLIEINPRLGGNSITPLIRTAYGADLAEATVLAAIGEHPGACLQRRRDVVACATRLFATRAPDSGLPPLRGRSRALATSPDILELELLAASETDVPVRVDEWLLLGNCLVRAASSERAISLASQVAADVLAEADATACEV